MSKQEELPDVRAWLLNAAELSAVVPPWQQALAGLNDASTHEDRLAVYQVIRDSGWLTENAGLYLIAALVEEMADAEAATKLRELDQRIAALEDQFGNAEGAPWTDQRAAEEYDELSDRYQTAWDEIFVGKLDACDAADIAKLYASDPDEFARRYAVGLEQFQAKIHIRNVGSADDLVRVASFVNLPQAELARNVLEGEGIPAALGNANLVLWEWRYSNATGGVSVHVRRGDAPRAHHLLTAKPARPAETRPPWICPACGQRITGGWEVCWNCGSSTEDSPGELLAEQFVTPSSHDSHVGAAQQLTRILGAVAILLFVLLPLAAGLVVLAVVNALLAGMLIFFMGRFASSAEAPGEARTESGPSDAPFFPQTRSNVSKAIVRRAWHAAMFGLCGFPPLGFYALWLLWRVAERNAPLGAADRWRVGLSFVLGLVAVLYCFAFVAGVAAYVLNAPVRPY